VLPDTFTSDAAAVQASQLHFPPARPQAVLLRTTTTNPLQVHAKSDAGNRYLVVLDAAAHAASHVLDLSAVTPDFVTLSFYKVCHTDVGFGVVYQVLAHAPVCVFRCGTSEPAGHGILAGRLL
jgi:hypothetical protein